MKEEKVTSLELSKALKDAGTKQESTFVWCDGVLCDQFCGECAKRRPESCPSAFDCHELLESLPSKITIDENLIYELIITKSGDGIAPGSHMLFNAEYRFAGYIIDPKCKTCGGDIGREFAMVLPDLNPTGMGEKGWWDRQVPVEALGELELWRLGNGHIKEAKP